jgi:hypothetical protein
MHITPDVDGIKIGATFGDLKSKTKVGELEEQNHLKLEQQLDKLRTLVEDRQEMAIHGQTLFDEAKINCQLLNQEMQMVLFHLK